MKKRMCKQCGEVDVIAEYGPRKNGRQTGAMRCKACSLACKRETDRQWRINNPEKVREKELRHRRANPGSARERSRRRRARNPERQRAHDQKYYRAAPEKFCARQRRYYCANTEAVLRRNRARRAKNTANLADPYVRDCVRSQLKHQGVNINDLPDDYVAVLIEAKRRSIRIYRKHRLKKERIP